MKNNFINNILYNENKYAKIKIMAEIIYVECKKL